MRMSRNVRTTIEVGLIIVPVLGIGAGLAMAVADIVKWMGL